MPIMGLGYRWGVDFASPLPMNTAGNEWVMVCLEILPSRWSSSHFRRSHNVTRLHEEKPDPDVAAAELRVFLDRRGKAFREVMPLAMRNLAIA